MYQSDWPWDLIALLQYQRQTDTIIMFRCYVNSRKDWYKNRTEIANQTIEDEDLNDMKIIKGFPLLGWEWMKARTRIKTWNLQRNLDKGSPTMLESQTTKNKILRYRTTLQIKWGSSWESKVVKNKNKSSNSTMGILQKCQQVATSCFSSISFSSLTSNVFKRTSDPSSLSRGTPRRWMNPTGSNN